MTKSLGIFIAEPGRENSACGIVDDSQPLDLFQTLETLKSLLFERDFNSTSGIVSNGCWSDACRSSNCQRSVFFLGLLLEKLQTVAVISILHISAKWIRMKSRCNALRN